MDYRLQSSQKITNDMIATINNFNLTKEEYKILKKTLKYIRKFRNAGKSDKKEANKEDTNSSNA